MAVEDGAFVVPESKYDAYLAVLPEAAAVVTDDGKKLTKAASRVASGRLPLKDIVLAAYLLDPTRTAYGLTYISETFDVSSRKGPKTTNRSWPAMPPLPSRSGPKRQLNWIRHP